MANGIKTRPVRRMTQAELDGFLEKAADILRGNVDHSEFRGSVFALLFFRRISDLYQEEVAFLMSEIIEPEPGHHVCDWASGSASLLLQCRRYVDKHHQGRAKELFLYAQESNVATYNISRINLILHGVSPSGWTPKREDSLRQPLHLDANKKLMQFDRIVMNPPFSLKSWGYDDFVGGDPYDRFTFGMPPADQGDYAWMQHVVKSLKPTGKAIIVMSQGLLFRGQPEQTEAEDGRNQKPDAEYVIREGFVKSDLIECVIVLPSKLFYGNNVPGCLVVLNKRKPEDRMNRILMIWASRHCEETNPQNLLRTSDLMRILVPWRAFGDLEKCRQFIPEHEAALVEEIEAEHQAALKDIHDAYDPVLEPLPELKAELARLDAADFVKWSVAPDPHDPYFGPLEPLVDELRALGVPALAGSGKSTRERGPRTLQEAKAELRTQTQAVKDGIKERSAEVKRAVRELRKLDKERAERLAEINAHADRQVAQVKEAAADLARICADPREAKRYFVVAERTEIEENEFNLNRPRYVDTFEPEEEIPVDRAVTEMQEALKASKTFLGALQTSLGKSRVTFDF